LPFWISLSLSGREDCRRCHTCLEVSLQTQKCYFFDFRKISSHFQALALKTETLWARRCGTSCWWQAQTCVAPGAIAPRKDGTHEVHALQVDRTSPAVCPLQGCGPAACPCSNANHLQQGVLCNLSQVTGWHSLALSVCTGNALSNHSSVEQRPVCNCKSFWLYRSPVQPALAHMCNILRFLWLLKVETFPPALLALLSAPDHCSAMSG
jgi:hypothetical protein